MVIIATFTVLATCEHLTAMNSQAAWHDQLAFKSESTLFSKRDILSTCVATQPLKRSPHRFSEKCIFFGLILLTFSHVYWTPTCTYKIMGLTCNLKTLT